MASASVPTGLTDRPSPSAGLLVPLATALVLTLGFGSVPLPVQAQVLPLTSLLAFVAMPIVIRMGGSRPMTSLARLVFVFAGFAIAHSLVALAVEALVGSLGPTRVFSWLRQVVALTLGVSVFVTLRVALAKLPGERVAWLALWSSVPGVALALVNLVWGTTGWRFAGRLIGVVGGMMMPGSAAYYARPDRATGFWPEPTFFAFFIAVVVVPAAVSLLASRANRQQLVVALLVAALVAFVWTFSMTGYLLLGAMLVATAVQPGLRRPALAALAGVAGLVVLLAVAFPENYLMFQGRWLLSTLKSANLVDASPSVTVNLFATVGPFLRAFSSLNLLGYGLGGTATHLADMVPAGGVEILNLAGWPGMPNLPTSLGRVFAETGLVGFAMFVGIWVVAFRTLRKLHHAPAGDGTAAAMLRAASLALVGLAVGHTVKFGSFALPYLWFWLAYVDSRSLLNGRQAHQD
jgi:hypothetical protein